MDTGATPLSRLVQLARTPQAVNRVRSGPGWRPLWSAGDQDPQTSDEVGHLALGLGAGHGDCTSRAAPVSGADADASAGRAATLENLRRAARRPCRRRRDAATSTEPEL